jgi:NhaA family Na+:H+ antiporter
MANRNVIARTIGGRVLGGIGFTMAIFVTLLAFGDTEMAKYSKLSILISSLLAGTIGYFILRRQPKIDQEQIPE